MPDGRIAQLRVAEPQVEEHRRQRRPGLAERPRAVGVVGEVGRLRPAAGRATSISPPRRRASAPPHRRSSGTRAGRAAAPAIAGRFVGAGGRERHRSAAGGRRSAPASVGPGARPTARPARGPRGRVELEDDERSGADRRLAERIVGERARSGCRSSRCAGAIGWVASSRNPPSGVVRSNRTVRSSTAVARHLQPRPGAGARVVGIPQDVDREDDVVARSRGSPSCQRASGRSVNVQVLPVSSVVQRSARSGISMPSGPELDEARERRARRGRGRPGSGPPAG